MNKIKNSSHKKFWQRQDKIDAKVFDCLSFLIDQCLLYSFDVNDLKKLGIKIFGKADFYKRLKSKNVK